MLRLTIGLAWAALMLVTPARAGEIVVECARPAGKLRPLHGVNMGPLDRGGLVDLSTHHRALNIPLTRLHDCHWPNADVVDLHVVFPDSRADPEDPKSYDFVRTDAYVKAIVDGGSGVVYRLGESIEHGPDKRRQRPPSDAENWAAACVGIIRHYNEGWAGGFRHDVRYWEIWNEPDNRPNCWTGTDEDYFRLYAAAARAIKRRFPGVRVGGPAVGNVGRVEWHRDGVDLLRTGPEPLLLPSPFVEKFLAFCRREAVPLDFFSWHLYCDDASAVAAHARGVRKLLDRAGFEKTESHLNEWNYLPDNDWGPVMLAGQGERRKRFADRVGGAEGAAFAAGVLIALQDCPLDAANYFAADTGEFGLFDRYGSPRKTFYAFKAFRSLLDTPVRLGTTCTGVDAFAAAGTNANRDAVTVLIGSGKGGAERVAITPNGLPWRGPTGYEVLVVDADHDLDVVTSGTLPAGATRLDVPLRKPSVVLIKLRKN
jgi:hypothetical protein